MNLGYPCINMTLSDVSPKSKAIMTNRTMRKSTFHEKGLPWASYLILQNVSDLYEIVKWNEEQGIKLFRVSSDIFPWASEYEMEDLPDLVHIGNIGKSQLRRSPDNHKKTMYLLRL